MKSKYRLFINTVDERQPSFIFYSGKRETVCSHKFIEKQEYLISGLKALMAKNKISIDQIGGLFVLEGKGSFTAVRAGVVLSNAIGFLGNIPVQMIDSSGMMKNFVGRKKRSKASAHYDREPNITL